MSKELQLMDSVNLVANISCSKCDREDETNCFDDDEAIREFYDAGWRATDRNTYCPKCAKKYLGKEKNKK
jgi:hypothetical protein